MDSICTMMPPVFEQNVDNSSPRALTWVTMPPAMVGASHLSLGNNPTITTGAMILNKGYYDSAALHGKIQTMHTFGGLPSAPQLNWNAMQRAASVSARPDAGVLFDKPITTTRPPRRQVRFVSLSCDDKDETLTTAAGMRAREPEHGNESSSSLAEKTHQQTPQELQEVKDRVKARANLLRQRRKRHHKKRCLQRAREAMAAAEEEESDDSTSSSFDDASSSSSSSCSDLQQEQEDSVDWNKKTLAATPSLPAAAEPSESEGDDDEEDDAAALLQQMRQQMQALACEELDMLNRCKAIRDKRAKIAKNYKRLLKAKKQRSSAGGSFVLPPTFPN